MLMKVKNVKFIDKTKDLVDPFNEEDWNEIDIPQEEYFLFNEDEIPIPNYIYIRRYNGEYHYFIECFEGYLKLNDVMDYINYQNNQVNNTIIVEDLSRPNSSEKKGLYRGKIKVGNISLKDLRRRINTDVYKIKF